MTFICPHCMNNTEALTPSEECTHCNKPLFSERPIAMRGKDFRRFLSDDAMPMLIDFWGTRCSKCAMMAPSFDTAAKTYGERVRFGRVNVSKAASIAEAFHIQSVPTLILFDAGGKELARQSGKAFTLEEITELIAPLIH